jgi:hypothetical protein
MESEGATIATASRGEDEASADMRSSALLQSLRREHLSSADLLLLPIFLASNHIHVNVAVKS